VAECLRVIRSTGARIRGSIENFVWEDPQCPELQQVRLEYDLDRVVAPARTQFDQVLRLMDWVHHLWRHDPENAAPRQDAVTILRGVKEGKHFRCVEYATLLVQLCTAFGWPARAVRMVQPYPGGPLEGQAHLVSEVWINDLAKWVCFDAQINAYWEYRGSPLSVLELQDLVCRGLGRKLRWRRFSPLNLHRYMEARLRRMGLPVSLTGAALRLYSAVAAKSDFAMFFFHPRFATGNNYIGRGSGRLPPSVEYVHPLGRPPQLIYNHQFEVYYRTTGDRSLVDFTCNLVDLDPHPPGPNQRQDRLLMRFRHCIPWFERLEVRLNDAPEWRPVGPEFEWPLKPGLNRLEVRGVNRLGFTTDASTYEVWAPAGVVAHG